MKKKEDTSLGGKIEFRLTAKSLLFTYSKTKIEKEETLEQLLKKLDIEKYVIGKEKHGGGKNHLHVFLELKKK